MEETEKTQIALAEVYDILKHTDENLVNKISKKFIQYIYDNMDKKYIPSIDYSKDIYSQNIMYETIVILSIIYRDYLCSLEEKNNIITKDKLELDKIREKEMQQFNVDVFKEKIKNNEVKKELNTQEMSLVEIKKERWYTKFFNKLKKFLRLTK